jgi:aspartyl protease family protein
MIFSRYSLLLPLALLACSPAPAPTASPTASLVVPADPHLGVYFVDGTVNDTPVTFLVDTGASMLNLPISSAKSMGIAIPKTYQLATISDGSEIQTYSADIKTLKVGGCTLNNVPATFSDTSSPYALFGESVIKKVSLVVANDRMKISCKG